MNEDQAILAAQKPQDIISPAICNEVISYLTEYINVLTAFEWEARLKSSQKKVELISNPDITNGQAKAYWEVSQEYQDWQNHLKTLRKFKAYKSDLRDRFYVLTNKKMY